MRKVLVSLIVLMTLALPFSGCERGAEVLDEDFFIPENYIKAVGTRLYDGQDEIILNGVNLGGWLLTEDWMTPTSLDGNLSSENGQYDLERELIKIHGEERTSALFDIYRANWITEKDFVNIKNIGFNCVRLPFGWNDFTDEEGNFKEDAFKYIDFTLEQCKKNSLYLILDLHGAYGSQNGRHHSGETGNGDLYGNEKNMELTLSLWLSIADRYKEEKLIVGYDLLNEPEGSPNGLTTSVQFDYYDRLYKEIRKVDSEHIIIFEACWDLPNMPKPSAYNWENVVYEYHFYNWEGGNSLSSTENYLSGKAFYEMLNQASYKTPVLIGEYNCFENMECWNAFADFFEENHYSATVWTYKGCVGGNWALYNGYIRAADNIVTPTTDYERAKEIFSSLKTEESFSENMLLIEFFKKRLKKSRT